MRPEPSGWVPGIQRRAQESDVPWRWALTERARKRYARPVELRPLRAHELARAAATLARVFQHNPLFAWLLPEPARRARWLGWFQLRALCEAYTVGRALTVAPSAAASGLYPARGRRSGARSSPLPRWACRRGGCYARASRSSAASASTTSPPACTCTPSSRSRTARPGSRRSAAASRGRDGAGGSCARHLETGNPKNLGLYGRFGYEVTHEITSHGDPPLWIMTSHRGG